MEQTTPEQVSVSSIPDFKQACNFLRADILATDKEVTALKGHKKLATLEGKDMGEVLANLTLAHRHLEDARMRLGKAIQHSESRESIFDIKQDPEKMARLAYKRYGSVTDFKNFQGNPMPEFDELPAKIQEAWKAAITVAEPVQQ